MNNASSASDRERSMVCRKLLTAGLLCIFLGETSLVWAQFPGNSEDFAARMLRRLDRDEDGTLDPDELDRAGPLKDYLARQNVDVDRPVPLGVVADHQSGMFREMQERGGFGGGPGGFGGPPGGGAPPDGDDRGSSRDGRRESSSGRDRRSDNNSSSGDDRRGGRGGRRGEGGSSTSSNQPAGKDGKSKVRVGRVGPKVTLPPLTLPGQYAARDINQDGQIGMYEWSRTDISTFRRLDVNGDGFLTPVELTSPSSGTSGGSTTVASTTYAPGSTSSSSNRTSTPIPSPAASSAPPTDLKTVAAQGAFEGLDTDKNGQLTEEEWQRSRYARKLFTEAKVEVQFPIAKTKFVEHYVKLAP